ncbi:hypothetical protein V7S43_018226 [Phytophthora oleae]|uniref:Uncharacterized protein n=1 Tax=Phytophthora oleae TaxID=2107226 RepID=A0ABD3ERD8_9STRA
MLEPILVMSVPGLVEMRAWVSDVTSALLIAAEMPSSSRFNFIIVDPRRTCCPPSILNWRRPAQAIMLPFMAPTLPSDRRRNSLPAPNIEKFRARHRRLCRVQQQAVSPNSMIESQDVDDGRRRKISVKWRQKQQTQHCNQFDDGYWPKSAGTEMHLGFNAFDFSASPEGFYDDALEPVVVKAPIIESDQQDDGELFNDQPEPAGEAEPAFENDEVQKRKQYMADVARQVAAMGFNSASLWEQRISVRQPNQPLSTYGQGGSMAQCLWRPPVHYATYDDQRRALYYQPQYYA